MVTYTAKSGMTVDIDTDKCTGCEECVGICPSEVFAVVDGKSTCPKVDECSECCACVDICPEKAIKHSSCQ